MMQSDPLAMTLYEIGILLLVLQLKVAVPTALQPWYADDAAAGGSFKEIINVSSLLMTTGLARRYFPDPTKFILAVKTAMAKQAKARFGHLKFAVITGTIYLSSFIRITSDKSSHIRQKVSKWSTGITCLSSIARFSPQAAFADFQQSY